MGIVFSIRINDEDIKIRKKYAPREKVVKDKSKYNRKKKHKNKEEVLESTNTSFSNE